jgi:hypothetical protein
VGEFAKGYEHGSGEMTYKDGSVYQGKYRYGRRDGPGIFITADGTKSKGVFRDTEGYNEKLPPTISEEILDDDSLFQPPSLLKMCIQTLAIVIYSMQSSASSASTALAAPASPQAPKAPPTTRSLTTIQAPTVNRQQMLLALYPSKRISKRLHPYMKPLVVREYLLQFPHIAKAAAIKNDAVAAAALAAEAASKKAHGGGHLQTHMTAHIHKEPGASSSAAGSRRTSVIGSARSQANTGPQRGVALTSAKAAVYDDASSVDGSMDGCSAQTHTSIIIDDFAVGMERIAMQNEEVIWFSGVKLLPEDIESLCYFEGSNKDLKELRLPSCKLKAYSIDLVAQQIERGLWPALRLLDMSYNIIEFATIQTLTEGMHGQRFNMLWNNIFGVPCLQLCRVKRLTHYCCRAVGSSQTERNCSHSKC